MKKQADSRIRNLRRRLRIRKFLKKNGLYVLAAACLLLLAALTLALSGGMEKGEGTPAANSLDERLSEAREPVPTRTPVAAPTDPSMTGIPGKTPAPSPTPVPTLIADMTPAPSTTPAPRAEVKWESPADGRLLRVYAMDCLIWSKTLEQWMTHPGVDISAAKGTEVRSVASGTVTKVYSDDMLGVTVVVSHPNGLETVYSCLEKDPPVSEGEEVASRTLLGYVGDTAISECAEGSHLHFEVRENGEPRDPREYTVIKSDK